MATFNSIALVLGLAATPLPSSYINFAPPPAWHDVTRAFSLQVPELAGAWAAPKNSPGSAVRQNINMLHYISTADLDTFVSDNVRTHEASMPTVRLLGLGVNHNCPASSRIVRITSSFRGQDYWEEVVFTQVHDTFFILTYTRAIDDKPGPGVLDALEHACPTKGA